MIVIGDKHSSNTQKLFEICKSACKDTYYIQTLDDLDLNQLGSVEYSRYYSRGINARII